MTLRCHETVQCQDTLQCIRGICQCDLTEYWTQTACAKSNIILSRYSTNIYKLKTKPVSERFLKGYIKIYIKIVHVFDLSCIGSSLCVKRRLSNSCTFPINSCVTIIFDNESQNTLFEIAVYYDWLNCVNHLKKCIWDRCIV